MPPPGMPRARSPANVVRRAGQLQIFHRGGLVAEHPELTGKYQLRILEHGPGGVARTALAPPVLLRVRADDRANAWAFKRGANPFNARLNAIFGSDIGHFDVPDMTEVLPEAYELWTMA